jgi:tetratricopeptide (TPR) repeat protein
MSNVVEIMTRYNGNKELLVRDLEKIHTELVEFRKVGEAVNDTAVNRVLALADVDLVDDLTNILNDHDLSKEVRIIAFYSLCTRYRRMKEFTKFNHLLSDHYRIFKDEEIYKIQKAYSLITYFNNKSQLLEAFNSWEYIDENYKKMPAFIQIYTDTVALCFENNLFDITKQKDHEILVDAINLISIAIKNRDYAKFYATLGRLQNCNREYDKAIMNIYKAIDKETPERSDYAIRISEYQLIITKIEISNFTENKLQELEKYKEGIREMKDEFSKSKYDNLSFLGFFSAVISLVIASIQTLSSTSLVEKYQILMALAGVIIISFGSLNLIMLKKGALKYSFITALSMFVFGMLLIVISILVIPKVI